MEPRDDNMQQKQEQEEQEAFEALSWHQKNRLILNQFEMLSEIINPKKDNDDGIHS